MLLELVVFFFGVTGKQFTFLLSFFTLTFFPILATRWCMMEDLVAIWDKLSLSEKEQTGYTLRIDHCTGEYMLAASF